MHKVVRPFPVSWDGLTLVDLVVGDERDFGDMTAGLLAEKYIEPVTSEPPAVVYENPTIADVTALPEQPVEPAARRGRSRKS